MARVQIVLVASLMMMFIAVAFAAEAPKSSVATTSGDAASSPSGDMSIAAGLAPGQPAASGNVDDIESMMGPSASQGIAAMGPTVGGAAAKSSSSALKATSVIASGAAAASVAGFFFF